MQRLAATISKELKTADHCAVYDKELARVWPLDSLERQRSVEQFAKERGWTVGYYKDGYIAIFTKESPSDKRKPN